MNHTQINEKIKSLGISKTRIAKELGLSLTYLSLMLKGERPFNEHEKKILKIIKRVEKVWQ